VENINNQKKITMLNEIIQYILIKNSSLFDKDFYLNTNPDVRDSGINPIMHYIKFGWKENRDPSPEFSTSWYLKTYKDVKEANINPLFHYLKYGIKESRRTKTHINKENYSELSKNFEQIDFMIIGAQRAGTTSLFKFLDSLPYFCGSRDKEVGFFSVDSHYNKGINWYHHQFQSCNPKQMFFEATPEYLYYPFVPGRIKKYSDNLRYIVMLRNPIGRCFSAWKLFKSIYGFDKSTKYKIIQGSRNAERESLANLFFRDEYPGFSEVVHNDIERFYQQKSVLEPSFVRRGLYFKQLSNWLDYFDISKFLFIEIDELNNYEQLMNKLQKFLSFEINFDLEYPEMPKYNKLNGVSIANIEEETIDLLNEFYFGHNENLFNLIGRRYDWNNHL